VKVDTVSDHACRLGEGPVWSADAEELTFVDILAGEVHHVRPSDGAHRRCRVAAPVGAAIPRAGGGFVLLTRDGFVAYASGVRGDALAGIAPRRGEQRFNDGKADSAGRIWAGTQCEPGVTGAGALYRLDPDGEVQRVVDGVTISNGLGWSPERDRMYYADTATGGVDVFTYDADTGVLTDRRRLATVDRGGPDGLTVDANGGLWVALFRGSAVARYTPGGALDRLVELPVALVTSCAFGDPDLGTLYVTTASHRLDAPDPDAGRLFAFRPGVTGLPADAYAA
jgi:sugar lactone lactonase YvrE